MKYGSQSFPHKDKIARAGTPAPLPKVEGKAYYVLDYMSEAGRRRVMLYTDDPEGLAKRYAEARYSRGDYRVDPYWGAGR